MITYQHEQFIDCYKEAEPMLKAHYEEIATDQDVKIFKPNYFRYLELDDQGYLRVFTARLGAEPFKSGRLIGYFVSFVMPHLHYSDTVFAINDIMYVHPDWRGGTVAYRMMKLASEDLKNLGAAILIIHMKTDYPFVNLLKRLGFHLTEENWERVL